MAGGGEATEDLRVSSGLEVPHYGCVLWGPPAPRDSLSGPPGLQEPGAQPEDPFRAYMTGPA